MAYVWYFPLIPYLIFLVVMNYVRGENFYCKADCNEDQYCCGNNQCCNNPLDLWYLWLGIVIICFILTIVIIVRCLTKKTPRENRYNRLSTDEC